MGIIHISAELVEALKQQRDAAMRSAAAWKAKAKQKREWCNYQAETISTMIVQRATEDPDYLPPSSRKLRAERDAAQALVAEQQTIIELNEQAIAERDARIAALEAERGLLNVTLSMMAYFADSLVSTANESEGVAGWHLNGDLLRWDQVEGIAQMADFVKWAVKRFGKECVQIYPDHFGLLEEGEGMFTGAALPFETVQESNHAPAEMETHTCPVCSGRGYEVNMTTSFVSYPCCACGGSGVIND